MYFAAAFIASLVISTSGLVTPHAGISRRHAQLAKARSAEPAPIPVPVPVEPFVAREVTKRSLRKRCIARTNSTSLAQPSSTPVASSPSSAAPASSSAPASSAAPAPVNVAPSPSVKPSPSPAPSSSSVKPSSTPQPAPAPAPSPSHSAAPPPPPPPPPPPKPTTSAAAPPPPPPPPPPPAPSPAPAPAPPSGGSSSDPYTGSHSGQGTFYATGLGACGITNNDSQFIVAISHILFDNAPGYDGVNPNSNPLCNKQLSVNYMGKATTVTITDRCVGCAQFDLDFSPSAFDVLADPSIGRLSGVDWSWND